ncbi:uncharacterized protein [Typha angustifolia]|uniref:uncharacterized protein n=1 Tax=Typha angustifolia TaxID=59011 RepID=UPI003C2D70A9
MFCWKLLWGRLPTREMLHAIRLGGDDRCCLCGLFTETIEHLFYACQYSKEVWTMLGKVQLEFAKLGASVSSEWITMAWGRRSMSDDYIRALVATTYWGIWKQHNQVAFGESLDGGGMRSGET